jgi:glucose/arabinose dehydrogenase
VRKLALAITACLALLGLAAIPAAEAKVKLKRVGRFNAPVYVASPPGAPGVFVVEQAGRIRVLSKGKKRTFLDIRGRVLFGGEQGLLSVAFAPDYVTSGLFYVYYVTNGGDLAIEEYRRKGRFKAARGSARRVLTIGHPGQPNHNGGQLQFGPDGFLYIGTGDGGGGGDPDNSAQDTNSLLGKLLRINPSASGGNPYSSPSSNPFAGGGGRNEIYSVGLRNPFRFSFDQVSKGGPYVVIGDVGQDRFEEVDYETVAGANGANFGWNDFEGNSTFGGGDPPLPNRHDRPIKVYGLGGANCALIGGYVISTLKGLDGRYVYGDFCTGKLRSFIPRLGGARRDRALGVRVPMLSSFGQVSAAKTYATSLNGPVFRLTSGKKRKKKK